MDGKAQTPYIINLVNVTKSSIKICYDRVRNGRAETYTMVSTEKPRPELYKSMKELAAPVAGLLEIETKNLNHRIRPYQVKFEYNSNDQMSAVIESEFFCPLASAHVTIKTPKKREPIDPEKDTQEDMFFVPYTVDCLRTVQAEAIRFIDGERAQTTLFKDDGKKSE